MRALRYISGRGLAVGVLGRFTHYDELEDFALLGWMEWNGWNGVFSFFVYVFCNYLSKLLMVPLILFL
jgi:hypothetical protein